MACSVTASAAVWFGLAAGLLLAPCGFGAEADNGSNTVSHPAPARAALASFQIEPGFKIELVAAEPMVVAPVALAFDENGRLFVAELPAGPEGPGGEVRPGRVRLLEGSDADGAARTSKVYAENLSHPSALACYSGGVFVAAGSEVVFLKDMHRDGGVDVRQVVLTGFGASNGPPPLLNSFSWGMDARIHAATAGAGGTVAAANWPGSPVSLSGSDFSFDPRTLAVIPETGPAQSGLTFDNAGRKFIEDFEHPLRLPMYEARYASRNPFFPKAPSTIDVASPATPIFRWAGLPSPASVPRRAPGAAPAQGRLGTNAVTTTWLTGARGGAVYRGAIFPANYQGNVFIPCPGAHAVCRSVLRDNGFGIVAERPPEESNREFLLSRDDSFFPVQVVNGPDGALYVVDWQDGRERGRIYRIVPLNYQRPKPPAVGSARTHELVEALAGNNGWYCDTASRLLYERRDPAAVPLLAEMLERSRSAPARLRALYALEAAGSLRETHVLKALADPDAAVRELGVKMVEKVLTNGSPSDALWNQLQALSADPALRVRYQLAFALGSVRRPERAVVLAALLRRDIGNPWMQTAALASSSEGAANLLVSLCSYADVTNQPPGRVFLDQLATMIGIQGRYDEVARAADFIAHASLDQAQALGLLASLGEGLRRTRSSLALVDPQGTLQPCYVQALGAAMSSFLTEAPRVAAVRLLAVSPYSYGDTAELLFALCEPQPYPSLQIAAAAAACRLDDSRVEAGLFARWPIMSPYVRLQALAALLSHGNHVGAVLDALVSKTISPGDLSVTQMNFLRTYDDPAISERAVRLLGPMTVRRPEVVERFKPALDLRGSSDHGRELFIARCAECHRLGGAGQTVGPDLLVSRTKGRSWLLESILEPGATVPAESATCVLRTRDNENVVGIKSDDNLAALTLRQPGGAQQVWPRLNIVTVQTRTWSLMPDGLEQGLSPQDLADLLDYLMTAPR